MAVSAWLYGSSEFTKMCGGLGVVHGAIDPQWTLISCLLRSAKAHCGAGRSHRFVGHHSQDRHAIRGILTLGILANET